MTFQRLAADNWHRDIPGARWFKADLHVHTIDDYAGGRAKMPSGLSGDPEDPEVLSRYAKSFLQGAVRNGVQVVGLTPHSPRVGDASDTSAVWRIVEEWNRGFDEDGAPFREKVYAVFPGFEPNVHDGRDGTHLLFLFDPEIGQDRYCKLFDAIMDARPPWENGKLRMTPRDAESLFKTLDRHREESYQSDAQWDYATLAPHLQGEHGLLRELKSDVLQLFPCRRLAGYELRDGQLPEDFDVSKKPGSFLLPFMREHRQSLFHGSDAYSLAEIGRRHTWFKLASPRIEALRQAFVASDSRMRVGFIRNELGELEPVADPPDVMKTERPWLRSVTVRGDASFFGGDGQATPETFRFSPDLTCIIGGSMTGKSTLLDGLRVHTGARLPDEGSIRQQVEARGRNVFLAGSPEVTLDCPGRNPTALHQEPWPAVFYAQNELQQLSQRPEAIESILARLVPSETKGIAESAERLDALDRELRGLAHQLAGLDEQAGEAIQAEERAKQAREHLAAFSEAGVERLHRASRSHLAWQEGQQGADSLQGQLTELLVSVVAFEVPEIDDDLREALPGTGIDREALNGRWERITQHLSEALGELGAWADEARRVRGVAAMREEELRVDVERALAARGFDANRLREFQALHQQVALVSSYEANRKEADGRLADAIKRFDHLRKERQDLVLGQRKAFDLVMTRIARDFDQRIQARRSNCGDTKPLESFLYNLAQRGVTRWWNDLAEGMRPTPEGLLEALGERHQDAGADEPEDWPEHQQSAPPDLGAWQMSRAVQETFRETMTRARRWELAAIRCPDRYHVEVRLEDGSPRRLDQLSGGQGVSVLLSLLLETADDRPLVIDQPEDQLDTSFLFATVLPALKRLKGRRQVIVATHNANIVVNGDADMVIQLEASAHHGWVACCGAIEEPDVRSAIVRTVDGGSDAFRLRQLKYGF